MNSVGEFVMVYVDSRTDIQQIRKLYNDSGSYHEKITTLGGQTAYEYDSSPAVSTIIYVPYAGKIYTVSVAPLGAEYIQRSLASFKFTR